MTSHVMSYNDVPPTMSPSLFRSRIAPPRCGTALRKSSEHTFLDHLDSSEFLMDGTSFRSDDYSLDDDDDDMSEVSLEWMAAVGASSDDRTTDDHHPPKPTVNFNDSVSVREHAVTVGDAAQSHDSCPLSLDWQYVEHCVHLKQHDEPHQSHHNDHHYHSPSSPPKRLSPTQRRQRIASVQGWTTDQVRSVEIERVLDRVNAILHKPEFLALMTIDNKTEEQEPDEEEEEISGLGLKVVDVDRLQKPEKSAPPDSCIVDSQSDSGVCSTTI